MVKLLAARACAKINLFLRVTGRRADGYHELDSIFLPISIADEIALEIRGAREAAVAFNCNLPALSDPAANLAARAARAFLREFGIAAAVRIDLTKRVPAGAGLGGGSSDAGTVLRMLARLERIDAPDRLRRIALELGADVPFFLDPRPARVGGIGERIAPLAAMPALALVIAAVPFEVATAAVFKALGPQDWSGPAPAAAIESILRGAIAPEHCVNDLAAAAIAQFPEIGRIKVLLEELGARAAQMTGSGGAVFGVFADAAEAARAAAEVRRRLPAAWVAAAATLDAAGAAI